MLILDDISDDSSLRRGRTSWHLVAGMDAVYDAVLVENCAYAVLGLHCEGERLVRAQRLYSDVSLQCTCAQHTAECTARVYRGSILPLEVRVEWPSFREPTLIPNQPCTTRSARRSYSKFASARTGTTTAPTRRQGKLCWMTSRWRGTWRPASTRVAATRSTALPPQP